jgi:hypothetical protein
MDDRLPCELLCVRGHKVAVAGRLVGGGKRRRNSGPLLGKPGIPRLSS